METLELVLRIVGISAFVVTVLSGMFITHSIYEEESPSFFEMWFMGFYMSLHLVPLFFYNSYKDKINLKIPLWVFRGSVILCVVVLILKSELSTG